jgi:hypothetical protein
VTQHADHYYTIKGALAALALLVEGRFLMEIRIMVPLQHIQAKSRKLYVSNINNSNITYQIY